MDKRVLFVDESFFEWFGLPREESNFCYGALSLPERSLSQAKVFLDSFRAKLVKFYVQDTAKPAPSGEVKSKLIYEISQEHRGELALKLAYFLRKHEGYIFSFFTTSQGFIHNALRDKYYEEYGKQYDDFLADADAEMVAVRDVLLTDWRDKPFNIALLQPLYSNILSFAWTFHRERGEAFRIQYDPREKGEDAALNQEALDRIKLFDRALEQLGEPGLPNVVVGFDTSLSSADSPGLQLVDFIVADIRNLFRAVPGFLEDCSERRILSAIVNPEMTLVGGRAPFYKRKLLNSTLNQQDELDLLFPHLKPFFARSLISCHAKFGEARHIDISNGDIWDLAD